MISDRLFNDIFHENCKMASKPTKIGEQVEFDQESGRWIYYGHDDGIAYEFDEHLKGWFPRVSFLDDTHTYFS